MLQSEHTSSLPFRELTYLRFHHNQCIERDLVWLLRLVLERPCSFPPLKILPWDFPVWELVYSTRTGKVTWRIRAPNQQPASTSRHVNEAVLDLPASWPYSWKQSWMSTGKEEEKQLPPPHRIMRNNTLFCFKPLHFCIVWDTAKTNWAGKIDQMTSKMLLVLWF